MSLDVEQDTSAHSHDGWNGLVRGKAVPAQELQLCQCSLEQVFGQKSLPAQCFSRPPGQSPIWLSLYDKSLVKGEFLPWEMPITWTILVCSPQSSFHVTFACFLACIAQKGENCVLVVFLVTGFGGFDPDMR